MDDEKSTRGVSLNTQQYGRLNKRKFDKVEKENFQNKKNSGCPTEMQTKHETFSSNKSNKNKKRRNKKGALQKKNPALKYEVSKPTLLQKVSVWEI